MTQARPRRPDGAYAARLSADMVVEAALSLATREGGSALTFRALGRELGADPAAIYRYFSGKDDLILAMADRILQEVVADFPEGMPWQERLMVGGLRTVAVFSKYAAVGAMIGSRTTRRAGEIAIVDDLLGTMKSVGLKDAEAVLCYRTYADFLLAYAATRAQYLLLTEDVRRADHDAWANVYGAQSDEEYPYVSELAEHLAAVEDDEVLVSGLQMMIDGIALRTARSSGGTAG